MVDPKLKLLRALRKGVRVLRTWDSEYVEGSTIRSTCRTCGFVQTKELRNGPNGKGPPMTPTAVRFLLRYWKGASGSRDYCPRCTRAAQDRQHPLPKKAPKS